MRILHALSTPPAAGAVPPPADPITHAPGSQAAAKRRSQHQKQRRLLLRAGATPAEVGRPAGPTTTRWPGSRKGSSQELKIDKCAGKGEGSGVTFLFFDFVSFWIFFFFFHCVEQHRHRLDQVGEIVEHVEHALHEECYARGVNATTCPVLHMRRPRLKTSPRDVNVTLCCLLLFCKSGERWIAKQMGM